MLISEYQCLMKGLVLTIEVYGEFYVCYLQLFLINSKSITAWPNFLDMCFGYVSNFWDQKKYRSPVEPNQQSFLDIYETVISVHSSITDSLVAHSYSKDPYFTFWVELGPYWCLIVHFLILKERSHESVVNLKYADVSFTTVRREWCFPHSERFGTSWLVTSWMWRDLRMVTT